MSLTIDEKEHRLTLHKQGLTDSEMAAELHLAHNTIQMWRKKVGLRPNKPRPKVLSLDEAIDKADGQMLEWLEELKERREKDGVR